MTPKYCPFCGETRLEELEPTEVAIDNMIWTIYHYECQFCSEVFDRIIPEGELAWENITPDALDDLIDMELDDDDNSSSNKGYQH